MIPKSYTWWGVIITGLLGLVAPSQAEWEQGGSKDEMTDEQSYVIVATSENDWKGLLGRQRGQLVIRCKSGKVEVFLNAHQVIKNDLFQHTVATRLRLDDAKALSETWDVSTDQQGMFSRRPKDFVQTLVGASRLRVEVPWALPTDSPTWVADFNLRGLDKKIEHVAGPCKWKPKLPSPKPTVAAEAIPAPQRPVRDFR